MGDAQMRAIKPGHLQDTPIKHIHTVDPQEVIDMCLACTVKGDCRPYSDECPVMKREAVRKAGVRDNEILMLINEGLSGRKIRDKLHIGGSTFIAAKKRLREAGKIK